MLNTQPTNLERRHFTIWRRRDQTWKIFMDVGVPENQASAKSGMADVNGAKLYYEITGAGHPLVLVNGSSLDRRMWDVQVDALSARYQVIRYDLRGIGKSSVPDREFSHGQDLYHLLKFLGVGKTYVLGLSFGGAFAIDFALEHPEMLDALIVASSTLSNQRNEYIEGLSALYQITREKGVAQAVQQIMDDPSFVAPENVAAWRRTREILLDNAHIFRTNFPLISYWQPPQDFVIETLSKITVPTLIIVGNKDASDIQEIADRLEKNIRGAKKVIITNAGHMVNLEKPSEFNAAVLDFLEGE